MKFTVSEPAAGIIRTLWYSIMDRVDGLITRFLPADSEPARRLPRNDVKALSTALDIFEAAVRRILFLMAVELGPRRAETPLPDLPFCLEECPPAPVIHAPAPVVPAPPAEDPDWFLKPPPAGAVYTPPPSADDLVSADGVLKRLRALEHFFNHSDVYLEAARDRLCDARPLLRPGLPQAFRENALTVEQVADFGQLHVVAVEAQAFLDTS